MISLAFFWPMPWMYCSAMTTRLLVGRLTPAIRATSSSCCRPARRPSPFVGRERETPRRRPPSAGPASLRHPNGCRVLMDSKPFVNLASDFVLLPSLRLPCASTRPSSAAASSSCLARLAGRAFWRRFAWPGRCDPSPRLPAGRFGGGLGRSGGFGGSSFGGASGRLRRRSPVDRGGDVAIGAMPSTARSMPCCW